MIDDFSSQTFSQIQKRDFTTESTEGTEKNFYNLCPLWLNRRPPSQSFKSSSFRSIDSPYILNVMSDSLKATIKGGLPLIIFTIGLLALVYFIVVPARRDAADTTPAIETSADQLSAAFSKDENAASDSYDGKVLRIKGTIVETGSEEAGQPYILLQGGGTGQPDVQCIAPSSDIAPMIQSLKKRPEHNAEGLCVGKQIYVVLRGCRIR